MEHSSVDLLSHELVSFCFFQFFSVGAKGAVEILYGHNKGEDLAQRTAEYTSYFANPLVSAQRGFVDDIIDPATTRRLICNDLRVLRTKKLSNLPRKHSNIPL